MQRKLFSEENPALTLRRKGFTGSLAACLVAT
jgi:hypothetical protein